jgi:hypothetical protein
MKVEQNLRQLNIKQIQRNNENKAMVQRPVSYTQQPKQTSSHGVKALVPPTITFTEKVKKAAPGRESPVSAELPILTKA